MPAPVNIQVGGNVEGNIVVGDNNMVVNTNYGTIIYKQTGAQVKPRGFAPQPPRAPRGFVNRSAELQKLETWISTNEIVLLHGPDGMGKSSLVRQAANSAAGKAMQSGVVSLEPFDAAGQMAGPDDIVQKLFDALFESDPQLKVDTLAARTYLSNTHPLILLDEVPLPQQLLRALPDLFPQGAILMAADVAGAGEFQRIAVGPLPRQEAIGLLASRAGLEVNAANRATLDALCSRLGDVSLAVVITGNVLRECHVTPEETLNFLQKTTVPGPATTNITPAMSQAALDRAFSFTFSRLSPEEKKVLVTAAITPGLSMAPEWLNSALGGVDETVVIEKLKSLELLFANSPRLRIQPGFRAAAQRVAGTVISENDIYTRLIQYLGEGLPDPTFIADELGNLLGALAWAARHTRWKDVIRLGRAIDAYLTLHGLWDAWETVLGFLREAALATGNAALEGWALHQLGTRLLGLGDIPGAGRLLRAALRIRQQAGDTTGAAYTQHNLNWVTPPPTPPVKPPPRFPWGGLIGGAAFILLAGMAAMLGLAYVFWPSAATPTDTPTATAPITLTPPEILPVETTITPSLTPSVTPTLVTPSITPSFTPSITPTPTPLGGSGVIVFESQPDPLATETYLLYVMNVGSGKTRQLLNDFIPASQAAWSPNGKRLAFVSRYNQNSSSQIYTVNADGSNLQMITSMDGNNFHPSWSPDGKRIVLLHQYPNSPGSDIYIISAFASADENNQNYLNLTNSDATGTYDYPEWSPDGKQIAYQAFWENNWEIFVMDADGSSDPSQLTKANNSENDWSIEPSWSPDGKQIAFASNRNGNWDIYLMGSKGGNAKPLTQDEFYDVMPDWSPDGQLIVFSSNHDGLLQIYLVRRDGTENRLLTKTTGNSLSPDWLPANP